MEQVQRSFLGGEIAPALRSRADLGKYTTGLALCKNMIVRAQGGVYSRPGMKFIGEVGDSNTSVRLIPFSFNTEQTYILVFQNLTLRFISNGAFIESGGSPYEIATPYLESELSRLKFAQDADVMTLVHHNHPPSDLKRLANDNWSLDEIGFGLSNFTLFFQDNEIVSTAVTSLSLTTDTIIFTAPGHSVEKGMDVFFPNGWNGVLGTVQYLLKQSGSSHDRYFKVTSLDTNTFTIDFDTSGLTNNATYGDVHNPKSQEVGTGAGDSVRDYFYKITFINAEGVESLPSNTVSKYDIQPLSSTHGLNIKFRNVNNYSDVVFYRIYKDSTNDGRYGWIADIKAAGDEYSEYTDFNIAPDYSDTPPSNRTPFNDVDNYPTVTNYYQQRKVYANTFNQPQTVYTSQVGYYDSMRTSSPLRDDDALTFTIASNKVNEIRHLVSLDSLIPLTSGGEWMITEGQDQVLTPSTLGARIKSYNGASWTEPAIIDDSVIYVQEKGNRIRDLKYSVADNIYQGNDLSIMAEHLFEDKQITEMVYADEPYSILWCVRDDGALLGMTYNREQNVWAWHQHNTQGNFESIATIGEDDRDAVYVCVNRTIGGQTKRYIERIEKRTSGAVEDCFYVDSGLSYNGAATATFSGLDHLEGKTVVVLADGVVVNDKVVTGGAITLDDTYSKVHVGLSYTPKIEMLQIDIPSMQQSLKGKRVNIPSLYIEIQDSRSLFAGVKGEELTEATPREVSYSYDAQPLNSWVEELNIMPQWSDGREVGSSNIVLEQRDPLPLAILSVTAEVEISG